MKPYKKVLTEKSDAELLKEKLVEYDISVHTLAIWTKISRSTLYSAINNKSSISKENAIKIAAAIGVPAREFCRKIRDEEYQKSLERIKEEPITRETDSFYKQLLAHYIDSKLINKMKNEDSDTVKQMCKLLDMYVTLPDDARTDLVNIATTLAKHSSRKRYNHSVEQETND